jgi:hypothetical protein
LAAPAGTARCKQARRLPQPLNRVVPVCADEGASKQRTGPGLQQTVAGSAEQAERGLGLPGRPQAVATGERGSGGRQRRQAAMVAGRRGTRRGRAGRAARRR